MLSHEDYLKQAIQLALENVDTGKGGPYGAVVVFKDQIIAACANQVTQNNDPTAHAEVMAIRQACQSLKHFQLTECILYSSCEPCPMCLGAIYWSRLQAVYFACDRADAAQAGFDDDYIYNEIALAPSQRTIPMQVMALQNRLAPFEKWQHSKGKIHY